MIPADNEPDLDDVPENVRDLLHVHPVHDVREVLAIALSVNPPVPPARGPACV